MNCFIKLKTITKLIFCIIIFFLTIVNLLQHRTQVIKRRQIINKCYNFTKIDILPSIEEFQPQENSIFFLETSCAGGLNTRQACAVESAAIAHPNRQIYVLFHGPVINKTMLRDIDLIENVNVARIHLNYSKGTVLENVLENVYYLSQYPTVHAADVLRFLTLYKWSGIYLDLDTIVVRNLDRLGNNWAAKQDYYEVAIGAMAFSSDDVGRTAIRSVVEEIQQSYNPELWSHNGNGAINRAFKRYCNVSNIEDIDTPHCKGFHLHETDVLYPVYWLDASVYFDTGTLLPEETEKTYIHHMWNRLTDKMPIKDGSPYYELAKRYCPNTFTLFRGNFGK